jgi:co-chaperonin GroES (HSP10)
MTTVTPLKKKVLVAENKVEQTTESGIILEGTTSNRESKRGTVIAVGPEVTMVSVGDVILLEWAKAQVVKIDDAQRVIIDEDNIVAVFEDGTV